MPRGRGHTPQVVVAPHERLEVCAGCPRRLPPPGRASRSHKVGSWKIMTKTAFWLEIFLAYFFRGSRFPGARHRAARPGRRSWFGRPALASQGATTTCGVCVRPRGTKYQRITIPSDATDPLEPSGLDARLHGGALARIQGWITSNDQ